jgi:DNA-binding response OmpR family regulator
MPVAAVPPPPREGLRAAPSPSSASSARGRTALLADEEREFREFVKEELRAAGYEVSVTDSGEEALLLAGSHPFDLIVLNVYLRRLLGIDACRRLKSDPALKRTPIILMGAITGPEGAREPRDRYGSDDFISTGIGREELAARIDRLTRRDPEEPPAAPPEVAAPEAPAPAPAKQPPRQEGAATGDEAEIRRLARIMISDIQIYYPEKFGKALREGTFFEAFSEELGRGKEMIDRRFGHLANRIQVLAAGLRDSLEPFRKAGGSRLSAGG